MCRQVEGREDESRECKATGFNFFLSGSPCDPQAFELVCGVGIWLPISPQVTPTPHVAEPGLKSRAVWGHVLSWQ